MRPTAPDRFHIELSNLLSREFRGEMTVNGKVEQVAVAPNEKKNIGQALPEVLRADRMNKRKGHGDDRPEIKRHAGIRGNCLP